MTPDEAESEGAEEAIEDLEAPASAQEDVAGGAGCSPTCGDPSMICQGQTCWDTVAKCTGPTSKIVVREE
jgi:hypothetical protein